MKLDSSAPGELDALARDIASKLASHGVDGVRPPEVRDLRLAAGTFGETILTIVAPFPGFELVIRAPFLPELPLDLRWLAGDVARRVIIATRDAAAIRAMLADAERDARACLLGEDMLETDVRVVRARLAPLSVLWNDAPPRVQIECSGLDHTLRQADQIVRVLTGDSVADAMSPFVDGQRLRAGRMRALAERGAAGFVDAVSLAAADAIAAGRAAVLRQLARGEAVELGMRATARLPSPARISFEDGVARADGAPDGVNLWQGGRLVLARQIGGDAARRLIGRPASEAPRHPWIPVDLIVTEVDQGWGTWIAFQDRLHAFDGEGHVIDTSSPNAEVPPERAQITR